MARETPLVVGGLTPFTSIDFPGRLAAVVFCQGCPWRCGYCHNRHLLPARPPAGNTLPWPAVLDWLESRRGLLDGVVFSGGEPLLQRGLPRAAAAVGELGFAVALHTGGAYPERLAAVLPHVDWVGFDVKAPFADYARITGADAGGAARESLGRMLALGVAHELRCTVDGESLAPDDLARMARDLASLGVSRLVLQPVRREGRSALLAPEFTVAVAAHLAQVEVREG